MDTLIAAVERLRSLPETLVDRNIGHGRAVFLAECASVDKTADPEWSWREAERLLAAVDDLVMPAVLPADYRFFLRQYGGLILTRPTYRLTVDGVGPHVMDWYEYVVEVNEAAPVHDLFRIATLQYRVADATHWVSFDIDVRGGMHAGGVLGFGPGVSTQPNPWQIAQPWRLVAPSFMAWVAEAERTRGTFGYTPPT